MPKGIVPRRVMRHAVTQPLDPSYRLIPLTQGQNAIVDAEDFDWLSRWNWCAQWEERTQSFYAVRGEKKNGRNKTFKMHRVILDCIPGELGDHENHDTLDNRRRNLRKCTYSQNAQNSRRRFSSRGFRGVTPYKGRWLARICINRKSIIIGTFDTPKGAANAYDEAAKRLHGEFAMTNF